MEHYYNNIHGHFNYEGLYTQIINSLSNEAHIVEIGAFKGKSSAYLAVEAINSGKNIKIDIIDSWDGTDGTERLPWSDYIDDPITGIKKPVGDIFEEFKKNLEPVWNTITPIKSLSAPAADLYKDASLDFVFIDANHHYDGVKEDIVKWLPKVKKGGTFAGHDWNPVSWPGVIQAVKETFSMDRISVIEDCWMVMV